MKQKPAEDESTAWLWAGLWLLSIYVSIPLARTVQEYVRSLGLAMLFAWLTIAMVLAGAYYVVREIRAGRLVPGPGRALLLAAIGGLFAWLTWSLRGNPEEAFHFVQYGVLSVLLYRALRHRFRDASIYLLAFGIGALAGTVDELIQWVVPRRFFDLRDIAINVLAGLLVQLAIGAGIRPPGIQSVVHARGIRLFCLCGVLGSVLFLFITVNTSARWDSIKKDFPLAARMDEPLIEYGYRIEDPELGTFFSRLTRDQLSREDAARGRDAAAVINRHDNARKHKRLIARLPAYRDPLLIEAITRLKRRDDLVKRSEQPGIDPAAARAAIQQAFFEHRILERYFPVTLAHVSRSWSPEMRTRISSAAENQRRMTSDLSSRLVTRVSPPVAMAIPAGFLLLFVVLERVYARRDRT